MKRSRLLVSVRDAGEAEAALAGGADWIDLKEPYKGPLGAVSSEAAIRTVEQIAGRRPISAALGELTDWRNSESRQLLDVRGIRAMKLGLAGCAAVGDWQRMWLDAAAEIHAAGKSLVAVIYADTDTACAPKPDDVIALARQTPCRYLLIDTFDKRSLGTLSLWQMDELREILNKAHGAGMRSVLAGGLTHADMATLPNGWVDFIAVRGAVCRAGRTSAIDPGLVRRFALAISGAMGYETPEIA